MNKCPLKNKATKKGMALSVILSLIVHLSILKIAGFSHAPIKKEIDIEKPLIVNIASIAAPSIVEQKISQDQKPEQKKVENTEKEVSEKPLDKLKEKSAEIVKKTDLPSLPKPKSLMDKTLAEKLVDPKPTELAEISPAAVKPREQPQEVQKISSIEPYSPQPANHNMNQQLTSNDRGTSVSTIMHTASEADYAHTTPPVYPRRAIDKGQQGIVIVKALISTDGSPAKVTVYTSSGYELLDMSAINAVKEWSFKPSVLQNDQIASWILVPVKFMIQG